MRTPLRMAVPPNKAGLLLLVALLGQFAGCAAIAAARASEARARETVHHAHHVSSTRARLSLDGESSARGGRGKEATNTSSASGEQQMNWWMLSGFFPSRGELNGTKPAKFDPWADHQPRDTRLGYLALSSIAVSPQEANEEKAAREAAAAQSSGCPLLLSWPDVVEIMLPDPCGDGTGTWQSAAEAADEEGSDDTGGDDSDDIMGFKTSCPVLSTSIMPSTSLFMPGSNQHFGSSEETTSLIGSSTELRDCHGDARYTIQEKVFHVEGHTYHTACSRFGSCDGTVFIQNLLYDINGEVVARTPRLTLFQDIYSIEDAQGNAIATATRIGAWSPQSTKCGSNGWRLSFSESVIGIFATPSDRWPIASLVMEMSRRDSRRRPSGLVSPSLCEAVKLTLHWTFAVAVLLAAAIFWLRFRANYIPRLCKAAAAAEDSFFPARVKRPALAEP